MTEQALKAYSPSRLLGDVRSKLADASNLLSELERPESRRLELLSVELDAQLDTAMALVDLMTGDRR